MREQASCGRAAIELPAGRIEGASFTSLQVGAMAYRPADRARQCGLGIWNFPDADECELVRRFTQLPIPIPGFGSSDCAKCRSYLLEWSNGAALPQVAGQEPMPPESGLMRHESSFLED